MIHLQATGQHKNKAGLTHSPVYYPFASTHMVNTQLLHVPNVHTKYRKYFRGFFNSRLLKFARNSRKLMYREYYHVYSIFISSIQEMFHKHCKIQNVITSYTGWPRKNGTVDTVDFQEFALINSYFLHFVG